MKDTSLNSLTVTSSYLLNLPSTINLMNFKKNTKVVKFTLLTELVYLVLLQYKNYNKLFNNILLQVNLIKFKIFQKIKQQLIYSINSDLFDTLKMEFKEKNINFENFIKKIIFYKKNLFFIKKFLKKNKDLLINNRNLFVVLLNNLKKTLKNNKKGILIKFIYLKKIELFIKKFAIHTFKRIKIFFYPIIFTLLKKETHQFKFKSFMRKIVSHYFFKNLNLDLSKDKLQSHLFKFFKISTRFNVRLLPYLEELHLKERNSIRKKKDIGSSFKYIISEIVKNFGFGYLTLAKMLNKNNITNIPLNRILNYLNKLKENSLNNYLNEKGLSTYRSNFFVFDFYRNNIDIYSLYKNNNIFILNSDYHLFFNKDFLNTYYLYNLFNSTSKRKINSFFLSHTDKQLEYFTFSPVKYYYYDVFSLKSFKNEIDSSFLLFHNKISLLLKFIKKYKKILSDSRKIKRFFLFIEDRFFRKNHYFSLFKKSYSYIYKNKYFNVNSKLIFLFLNNLLRLYNSKRNEIENNMFIYRQDYFNINQMLDYLSKNKKKKISSKFLIRQRYKITKKLKYIVNSYLFNYFNEKNNTSIYNNVYYNKLNYKDINNVNKLFNFSEIIKKNYIYNKYNFMYKKYFSYIRYLLLKNSHLYTNSLLQLIKKKNNNKFFINKSLINAFTFSLENKNRSCYFSDKDTKVMSRSYKEKLYDKVLFHKVLNINIKNVKVEDLSNFINSNIIDFNSLIFNHTLKLHINSLSDFLDKSYISCNKEVLTRFVSLPEINLSFKSKIINNYKNNLYFINKTYSFELKDIVTQENINNFFYKKLLFYKKLISLTKSDKCILYKNNVVFILNIQRSFYEYSKLNFSDLSKVNNLIYMEDLNRLTSKTVNYTTTELKKMTKFQMKKKKLRKIY